MRLILCVLLVVVMVSCIATPAAAPEAKPAPKPLGLFNGKNLDGWGFYLVDPKVKMADVWSVKDGVLICKGEPLGYLCTNQDYTNFRLIVEWRWAPGGKPGNSGVLMRITGKPQGLPRCMEAQLQGADAGDLYGFHGFKIGGDPARLRFTPKHPMLGDFRALPKTAGNEKAPGEWNRYDITVQGGSVVVLVNGKELNRATDCEVIAGKIGLQSEGGEVHFRTVKLTQLP